MRTNLRGNSYYHIELRSENDVMNTEFPMRMITDVANECQLLLTEDAEELARDCGFVKRKRKITGSNFVQALVLTWADDAEAAMAAVVSNLEDNNVVLTEEALRKRFTQTCATFLRTMVEKALSRVLEGRREAIPLLRRFNGVYLDDCSTITLPADLAKVFPGCGGSDEYSGQAGIKMFVRLEVSSGAVAQLRFLPARDNDISAAQVAEPMPSGALHVADLGFFDTDLFQTYSDQGVYWISRAKAGLTLATETQPRQALADFLQQQSKDAALDLHVRVGQKQFACRMVALPGPPAVAERRKRKLRERLKRKGHTPSQQQLVMCEWTVFFTNIPAEQLSVEELYVLYRLRWQIELLFKRWKSIGGLAFSHGRKGYRVLCEFYAKLLGLLVLNWILLLTGGPLARHSPERALRIVCKKALKMLSTLMASGDLTVVITIIVKKIRRLSPRKRRRKRPTTRQLLFRPRVES